MLVAISDTFLGDFGVLYGLLGSWEIPRAKNVELYDVFQGLQ